MRIGAHVSIKDGLVNAPRNAAIYGCECFQIFTRSPRGGPAKPITTAIAEEFRAACKSNGQGAWYVHSPYFVNLASDDDTISRMSAIVIREELERGCAIGSAALMTHMGSSPRARPDAALHRTISSIKRILKGYSGETKLLVEIAAGPDSVVGKSFDDLSVVIRETDGRCGVCLDTQHMFASGYDLRTPEAVDRTIGEFESVVGIRHLRLIHVNDSKVPLGSRKDRHEHIGKGEIGIAGFKALLNDQRLLHIDAVLETRAAGVRNDVDVLKSLRVEA